MIQSSQPIVSSSPDEPNDGEDDDGTGRKTFNIQLEPNFKIFIAGPSRSGKSHFCSQLLANLSTLAKSKPTKIIYVYAVWQKKLKELRQLKLVDIFLQGGPDLEDRLKQVHVKTAATLIIFDDMMVNKANLPYISSLFAIGRHSKLSLIFITQKIFVNDNSVRIIRENADYYVLMKNPTNVRSISILGGQLNSNPTLVSSMFWTATHNKPYSYLFCNVTQQATVETQYLSELFERDHIVVSYIIETNMADFRKPTRFHKMYLVSADKLDKVINEDQQLEPALPIGQDNDEDMTDMTGTPAATTTTTPSTTTPDSMQVDQVAAAVPLPASPPPTPQPATTTAPTLPPSSLPNPSSEKLGAAATQMNNVGGGLLKRKHRDIGAGRDEDGEKAAAVTVDPPAGTPEDPIVNTIDPATNGSGETAVVPPTSDNPFPNVCPHCGKSLKNAKGLKIHITRMHGTVAAVSQDKKITLGVKRKRNDINEDDIEQLSAKKMKENNNGHCFCKICLLEFKTEQDYNRHVEEEHMMSLVETPSDIDNPMEEDEEANVEKRVKSNQKKAALNRKILARKAKTKLRLQAENSAENSENSEAEELEMAKRDLQQKRSFVTKKNKQKAAASTVAGKLLLCKRCNKHFSSNAELKQHFIAKHQ